MDNVIREAFTKYANEGSLYYVWVFDPVSGEVDVHDAHEQDSTDIPGHDDFAEWVPHPDRIVGYAYRIIGGWRVTDADHKPLQDRFVLSKVQAALSQSRTGSVLNIKAYHSVGEGKWAWVEGVGVERWADDEHGVENIGEDTMKRRMDEKGVPSDLAQEYWDSGEWSDYMTVAHFEVLVKLALRHPQLQAEFADLEGLDYSQLKYPDVVERLNSSGIKWAIGLDSHGPEGPVVELGAKGDNVTLADIEQNVGRPDPEQVDDIQDRTEEDTFAMGGDDSYGLKQNWVFGRTNA